MESRHISVSFDPNGGTVSVAAKQISYDSSYSSLPTPVYEGYAFDGWFTELEGGAQVTSETMVTSVGDRTIYAHWSLIHYTVRFDANGGESVVDTISVTIKDEYGSLPGNSPLRPSTIYLSIFSNIIMVTYTCPTLS